jgi:hypothetical protein
VVLYKYFEMSIANCILLINKEIFDQKYGDFKNKDKFTVENGKYKGQIKTDGKIELTFNPIGLKNPTISIPKSGNGINTLNTFYGESNYTILNCPGTVPIEQIETPENNLLKKFNQGRPGPSTGSLPLLEINKEFFTVSNHRSYVYAYFYEKTKKQVDPFKGAIKKFLETYLWSLLNKRSISFEEFIEAFNNNFKITSVVITRAPVQILPFGLSIWLELPENKELKITFMKWYNDSLRNDLRINSEKLIKYYTNDNPNLKSIQGEEAVKFQEFCHQIYDELKGKIYIYLPINLIRNSTIGKLITYKTGTEHISNAPFIDNLGHITTPWLKCKINKTTDTKRTTTEVDNGWDSYIDFEIYLNDSAGRTHTYERTLILYPNTYIAFDDFAQMWDSKKIASNFNKYLVKSKEVSKKDVKLNNIINDTTITIGSMKDYCNTINDIQSINKELIQYDSIKDFIGSDEHFRDKLRTVLKITDTKYNYKENFINALCTRYPTFPNLNNFKNDRNRIDIETIGIIIDEVINDFTANKYIDNMNKRSLIINYGTTDAAPRNCTGIFNSRWKDIYKQKELIKIIFSKFFNFTEANYKILINQDTFERKLFNSNYHVSFANLYDKQTIDFTESNLLVSDTMYYISKEKEELHILDKIAIEKRNHLLFNYKNDKNDELMGDVQITFPNDECFPINRKTLGKEIGKKKKEKIDYICDCMFDREDDTFLNKLPDNDLTKILLDLKISADALCAVSARFFDCIFISGDLLAIQKALLLGCHCVYTYYHKNTGDVNKYMILIKSCAVNVADSNIIEPTPLGTIVKLEATDENRNMIRKFQERTIKLIEIMNTNTRQLQNLSKDDSFKVNFEKIKKIFILILIKYIQVNDPIIRHLDIKIGHYINVLSDPTFPFDIDIKTTIEALEFYINKSTDYINFIHMNQTNTSIMSIEYFKNNYKELCEWINFDKIVQLINKNASGDLLQPVISNIITDAMPENINLKFLIQANQLLGLDKTQELVDNIRIGGKKYRKKRGGYINEDLDYIGRWALLYICVYDELMHTNILFDFLINFYTPLSIDSNSINTQIAFFNSNLPSFKRILDYKYKVFHNLYVPSDYIYSALSVDMFGDGRINGELISETKEYIDKISTEFKSAFSHMNEIERIKQVRFRTEDTEEQPLKKINSNYTTLDAPGTPLRMEEGGKNQNKKTKSKKTVKQNKSTGGEGFCSIM